MFPPATIGGDYPGFSLTARTGTVIPQVRRLAATVLRAPHTARSGGRMNVVRKESAMHRSQLLRAIGPVSLVLIVSTGTMRGDSPAPLAPFQFLLGEWEGIGDQAGATGGFTFAPGV